jgi:hypothetical protein
LDVTDRQTCLSMVEGSCLSRLRGTRWRAQIRRADAPPQPDRSERKDG